MAADTTHMVVSKNQPRDGLLKVWRYIDLSKLIDFLQTGSLHFATASTLGDPYEGAYPLGSKIARENAIRAGDPKYPQELIDMELKNEIINNRNGAYINCWHASAIESAAMWKLYATGGGSVALQSTYNKLRDAVPSAIEDNSWSLCIGCVDYLNYSSV